MLYLDSYDMNQILKIAAVCRSLTEAWTDDLPIIDHTPHYPQPDEFNKSNWKSLPRIIKEEQVTYHTEGNGLRIAHTSWS